MKNVLFTLLLFLPLLSFGQKLKFNKSTQIDTLFIRLDIAENVSSDFKNEINIVINDLIKEFNNQYKQTFAVSKFNGQSEKTLTLSVDSVTFASVEDKRVAFVVTALGTIVVPLGMVSSGSTFYVCFWMKALSKIHCSLHLSPDIKPVSVFNRKNWTPYFSIGSGWFRSDERIERNLKRRFKNNLRIILKKSGRAYKNRMMFERKRGQQ